MTEDVRPYRNRQPRYRAARRREMKAQGTIPANRQWIWCVRPGVLTPIPEWARQLAVKSLGIGSDFIWLWPVDARRLIKQDREAGGLPEVQVFEARRCKRCGRVMIADEAVKRRKLDTSGPDGRKLPCGPRCDEDRRTMVWKKLAGQDSEAA